MIATPLVRLARSPDAVTIAEMSRDYIEYGLGWSWTPTRVLAAIRDRSTNTAVLGVGDVIDGFGIMQYGDETAHLALLAVRPMQQHRGLGSHLLAWLEEPARVAGIVRVRLEARADNPAAIGFYRRLGYLEIDRVRGYYRGSLDAVRLEKALTSDLGSLAR